MNETYIQLYFPFLYVIRFQTYWSLEPLSSTPGGDRHMRSRTFSYKIQFWTTFTWSFFWYSAYFWQHWAHSESNFPFLYIIRFQTHQFLEHSSSTREEDKHMRSWTFLYKIQFRTTFIWSIFWCNVYFWQRWVLKWTYFPIQKHYNI